MESGNGSLSNGHSQALSASSSPAAGPTSPGADPTSPGADTTRPTTPPQEHSMGANGNSDATAKVADQNASRSENGNRSNVGGAQEEEPEQSQVDAVAEPDHAANSASDIASADQVLEINVESRVQDGEPGTADNGATMHMADAGDGKKKKHRGGKKKKKGKQ